MHDDAFDRERLHRNGGSADELRSWVWSTDSGILVCNDSSIDATFVASSPGAYKVGATDLQSSKPHPGQTPDVHLADFPSVASRVSQVEYWSEEAAGGRVCI